MGKVSYWRALTVTADFDSRLGSVEIQVVHRQGYVWSGLRSVPKGDLTCK
jgi:hypothetical protein